MQDPAIANLQYSDNHQIPNAWWQQRRVLQDNFNEDEEGDADVEVDDKSAAENALVLVNHGLQETSGLKL